MKNLFFDELSEKENNKIHEDNIKAFDETENDPEKYLNYKDKENNIKKMSLSEKIELAEKTEVSKILKHQDKIKGMTFIEKKYLARTTDDAQNIAILSKYENPRIHMQLVLNEHTPESVINDILDNDFNDHEIAKAVLSRKDLSEEVKEKAEKICLNEKNIENDKADSNKLLFDKEENNEEVSKTSELGIVNNLQEFPEGEKEQLNRNNLSLKILNTLNIYDFYKTLVDNPFTQSNTLDLLSKCEYAFIRIKVATHPNVQPTTLNELSKDRSVDVRDAIAKNKNTPPEILAKLAKDKEKEIRETIALNENTTPEILDELSKDKEFQVRTFVARNKNTPEETLNKLSKDKSIDVRNAVARNKNTPEEALNELSKDKHDYIKLAIIENKSTPLETLKRMSEDKNASINIIAKNKLDYRKSNLTPINKADLGIESDSREKEDYER